LTTPKTKKKTKTSWADKPHVVIVLDESSSMTSSVKVAINSVNEYVDNLRKTLPKTARVSLFKFSSNGTSAVWSVLELKDVPTFTAADYNPNGMTPLYDAIGTGISTVDKNLKSEPAPVYFSIITDGEENYSKEFNKKTIKELIEKRQEDGWTFMFLGVDIDAYQGGSSIGIGRDDSISLSRATLSGGIDAMMRGVGAKFASASNLAASGLNYTAYVSTSKTIRTFSDEDKKKLEE